MCLLVSFSFESRTSMYSKNLYQLFLPNFLTYLVFLWLLSLALSSCVLFYWTLDELWPGCASRFLAFYSFSPLGNFSRLKFLFFTSLADCHSVSDFQNSLLQSQLPYDGHWNVGNIFPVALCANLTSSDSIPSLLTSPAKWEFPYSEFLRHLLSISPLSMVSVKPLDDTGRCYKLKLLQCVSEITPDLCKVY